jgi:hypothetical protein
MATFRDAMKALSPPWLSKGTGETVLYSIGLMLDGLAEFVRQGMNAHMPTRAPADALPVLGSDRQIVQGFAEPPATYALRLSRAFDSWAHAGSPRGRMQQLLGYVFPVTPKMATVTNAGKWDTLAAGSAVDSIPTTYYASPNNWDWDGNPGAVFGFWFRIWPIIFSGVWVTEGTWGDGQLYTDGGTWGTTATPSQVTTVRAIIKQWKGQHANVPWILIALDNTKFDASLAAGTMADGTWGHWGHDVAGNYQPAREATARYWDGVT